MNLKKKVRRWKNDEVISENQNFEAELIIVTVVKDDWEGLELTSRKLSKLNINGCMHVIIAGSKVPEKVIKNSMKSNMETMLIEEEDSGIYDAMNKAKYIKNNGEVLEYFQNSDEVLGDHRYYCYPTQSK